jgi:glutathione reductase (NADPH)
MAGTSRLPRRDFGITSNEVFHLETLPRRILIAGGGYIANEFAGIFNEFGTEVTLMTRGDAILRGYDDELCQRLQDISVAKGISFRFHAVFQRIEKRSDGSLIAHIAGQEPIAADTILFAVGRVPKTFDMGLEAAGVALDPQGAIRIDAQYQTSVPSVFAVGDVTNRVQLTPVAIREGQCFADTQFGGTPSQVDYEHIPSAVFSHPPMAGVGLTEASAHALGRSVKIFRSSFKPMKNVLAGRDERALYKMIVDAETGHVLGIHMIGPDAPEILQVAAVAVKAGLTKAAFDQTIALHPSMAEELVLLR